MIKWVRPDLDALGGGVLANGLTNVLAGLLGTVGVSTYTSGIGLAGATGVTSRRVGGAIGGIFFLIAFLPRVSAILLAMPRPVIGAALVFSACFVFVNGLQIITSRMLDARRTFVVGTSFMLGLAVDLFPGSFADLPPGLRPIFSSSLVLGTLTAIGLNALFRLGVRQRAAIVVHPREPSSAATQRFLDEQGARWGARSDVIDRASFNLAQSIETIAEACKPQGPLEVEPPSTSSTSTCACPTTARRSPPPEQRGDHRVGGRAAQARGLHAAPPRRPGGGQSPGRPRHPALPLRPLRRGPGRLPSPGHRGPATAQTLAKKRAGAPSVPAIL